MVLTVGEEEVVYDEEKKTRREANYYKSRRKERKKRTSETIYNMKIKRAGSYMPYAQHLIAYLKRAARRNCVLQKP